jgi:hypothetical protein
MKQEKPMTPERQHELAEQMTYTFGPLIPKFRSWDEALDSFSYLTIGEMVSEHQAEIAAELKFCLGVGCTLGDELALFLTTAPFDVLVAFCLLVAEECSTTREVLPFLLDIDEVAFGELLIVPLPAA